MANFWHGQKHGHLVCYICSREDSRNCKFGIVTLETDTTAKPKAFWGHTEEVVSIAKPSSAATLFTTALDGTARVWDLDSTECRHVLLHPVQKVIFVGATDDGRHCVTCTDAGSIRLWDVEAEEVLQTSCHSAGFGAIAFCSQRNMVIFADKAGNMYFYKLENIS